MLRRARDAVVFDFVLWHISHEVEEGQVELVCLRDEVRERGEGVLEGHAMRDEVSYAPHVGEGRLERTPCRYSHPRGQA